MVKVRRCFKLILLVSTCYVLVVCLNLLFATVRQNRLQTNLSLEFGENGEYASIVPVTSIKHGPTSGQISARQSILTEVDQKLTSRSIVGNRPRLIRETTITDGRQRLAHQSTVVENSKRIHFISVSENGRLGNQMFEIATLTVTALRLGFIPVIPGHNQVKQVFDFQNVEDTFIDTNTVVFNEEKAGTYDSKIESLSHDKNWTLNGYFQSWKYFHHFRNEILTLFKFKPNMMHKAIHVIKPFLVIGRPVVCVHVRRGDKAQPSHLKIGNSVATPAYLTKAFNFFRKNLSHPIFVVTSDDRLWTGRYANGPDIFFVGTGCPGTDLAILSICNHTIITVGAFGWWGAYLSGGITVYYKNYPQRNSWLSTQYKSSDYYLPGWIGIE